MITAIIPTYNAADTLENLLGQLRGSVDHIIVSDGCSADQSLETAISNGACIALGAPGRGRQLVRGAKLAKQSCWLLFLHADSRLPENWQTATARHIENHKETAGYFDFKFNQTGFGPWGISRLANIRSRYFGLPYGDQGLLISQDLYHSLGGFDPMPLFEDVAMARKLGKNRLRSIGVYLTTDAEKYEREGYFRRGWRNFRLLRRYLRADSLEDLVKAYQ